MGARLAYSIAFKAVREILILDEIFAVGDAGFQERCETRYRELRAAGHTVLIVSHAPLLIREFCDRALLLEKGSIILDDSADRVCDAYEALLQSPASLELAAAGS
jgi:ABC-type polysaccharide/polyol phosphate transport system ATPase subunit